MTISQFREEVEWELLNNIVPFWIEKSRDNENGGFVGRITGTGDYDWTSDKTIILNSRILWSFSALHNYYKKPEYYEVASRAYKFIMANFWDGEFGGVYWSINHMGRPIQTKKQIYAQAFMILALTEYYKCNNEKSILSDAIEVFNLIEIHGFDKNWGGYFEAFTREWDTLEDVRLSSYDINANLTTNTHLRLLEGYTNLAGVWKNEKLLKQLNFQIVLFLEKIIDVRSYNLRLFFDDQWRPLSPEISFGHNIESSWLLSKACCTSGATNLQRAVEPIVVGMTESILNEAINPKGGLLYGSHSGVIDEDAHWWTQAEGMIGFLNAYQITGDNKYIEAVYSVWNFTKEYIHDRNAGEWYFRVDKNGKPNLEDDKIGPWKAPYHNMRACLEILERTQLLINGSVR